MHNDITTFKSSGKFLITAEYLILKGAIGLALPLKYGQTLSVKQNNTHEINWESKVFGNTWFNAKILKEDLGIISSSDETIANSLQNVFKQSRELNPGFLQSGVDAIIEADFNLSWGLGSSSTMIYNISKWANIDPYTLLEKTFGGSGYDIACAGAKGPITYQLNNKERIIDEVDFHPPFHEHIFFTYLGKKMNSRTGMSYFKEKAVYSDKEIETISSITEKIISCKDLPGFDKLVDEHEKLMSSILKMPTVKESNFPDYGFSIKSMGAWGGDFVLVTGESLEEVKKYFHSKGLDTVIPYHEIVLS